ncbi:ribonuclease P 40kDa subunit-domain-containing protein [Massariosphaeria phaeospora]|uniref:Ribonuclease P 40kDa subunit-domain-containing protein n=1 Tax=Massariosphaeria phaeospora TaxID=100035 RepID=A0A7C8M9I0_9PLEO|nr:ribonuclease P 40kDa subunit-domain-containing protein [Massariosphaeria phaeospora]
MLAMHRNDGSDTKFYFSHSLLPRYIDPHNIPTKKKPFSTFGAQHFTHRLDLILPEEVFELVRNRLEDETGVGRAQYARVYMKLGELLQGDFFTEYIKKGNITMLSEGRPLVDNVFSLYEGVLRIEVDRPTYERCGLEGKPIEDGGRKHQKNRWVMEFDLRQPSMLHGKKGFSRLEWACKNVLDQSLTWLFFNFSPTSRESLPEGNEPISTYHPFIHSIAPVTTSLPNVLAPELTVADLTALYDQEDSLSLLEYLNLLSLDSPRVNSTDKVDAFLSRYAVPDFDNGVAEKNMVRVRWRGFISPQFVRELFLTVRTEGMKVKKEEQDGDGGTKNKQEKRWFALSGLGFGGQSAYTVMQWAGRETLVWVCE